MVMTLNLDYWETYSLTAGCNLYTTKFYLCVQNVRSVAEQQLLQSYLNNANNKDIGLIGSSKARKTTAMYFHESEKSLVPAETFLATAVPKILITSLIIFLNIVAIITLIRSNRWSSSSSSTSTSTAANKSSSSVYRPSTIQKASTSLKANYFILPQSTQGLLHSLFTNYLLFGLVVLYSQISLSIFLLSSNNSRIFDDQGKECLVVNCLIITLSLSIALHLISLAVDRMLVSYLNYKRYISLSQGTIPLWLLSIWLPSIILGLLPIVGWRKTNFSFCVFIYQFNDDYLRFISWFFIVCICLIPCIYIYFLIFLKAKQGLLSSSSSFQPYNTTTTTGTGNSLDQTPRVPVVYRWYRKLQSHHRLTFSLILAINILCWLPFHVYLLLSCQTCPYSEFSANGFILEYLFMFTLTPSLVIPLLFSLRSNFLEKCASKIVRCVTFRNDTSFYNHHDEDGGCNNHRRQKPKINPLASSLSSLPPSPYHPQKSSLFFIDDIHSSSNASFSSSVPPTTSRNSGASSSSNANIMLRSDKENNNNTFFVPHYLPPKDQIMVPISTAAAVQKAEITQENHSKHYHHNHNNHHRHHYSSRYHQPDKSTLTRKGEIIVPAQVHQHHHNANAALLQATTGTGTGTIVNQQHVSTNNGTSPNKKKKKKSTNPSSISHNTANRYKSSFKSKYDSYSQQKTLPLRNFCAYLNTGAEFQDDLNDNTTNRNQSHNNNNNHQQHENTYNSLESDMKYGFPKTTPITRIVSKPSQNQQFQQQQQNQHQNHPKLQSQQQYLSNVYYDKRHGIYYNSDDEDDGLRISRQQQQQQRW